MLRRLSIVAAVVAVSSIACSTPPETTSCPKPSPAFRFQVTAAGGVLPPDTSLVVSYQGCQHVRFPPAPETLPNDVICCQFGDPTAGPLPAVPCNATSTMDAGVAKAISCDLWTVASTEVIVHAKGYAPIHACFTPPPKDDPNCAAPTADERKTLQDADGGNVEPVPCTCAE